MNEHIPAVEMRGDSLVVKLAFSTPHSEVSLNCVIDVTSLGEIAGVEILDLRVQLSGLEPEHPSGSGDVRWSYDEEVDAFYLHLLRESAPVQQSATCRVQLDVDRRMVGLAIEFGSAGQ